MATNSQRSSSRRVTIVLANLALGGVQRVAVRLSAGLHERGYHVTVLTFADESRDFFPLTDGVARVALGIARAAPTPLLHWLPSAMQRLSILRRAVRESAPDVVIARAAHVAVSTLIATKGLDVPVIVTEHGDKPTRDSAGQHRAWNKWLAYRLRRLCYPQAYRVVSVSRAVDQGLAWLPDTRRTVIHNPILSVPQAPADASLPPELDAHRPLMVSMGRLSHAKGFDILLSAFSAVASRFPQWQLAIIGDGELRAELRALSRSLGLEEQVAFVGAMTNPFPVLQRADVFVMASRYEGFPNAHGEALSCGLPVIATDCPSVVNGGRAARMASRPGGVSELVRHGIDGWLVPPEDPAALAAAMDLLMRDAACRNRLASHAVEASQRFSVQRFIDQWDAVLHGALAVRAGRG